MQRIVGGKLLVATHNAGKLEEIRALLLPYGVEVVSAAALGLTEPEETEDSFVGNARIKAHAGVAATGLPTLADDSGICVDALHGAPGVYTADWAETAQGRDFDLAMQRVWDAVEACAAPFPRRAAFHSTLVLAWPDGSDAVYEGVLQGILVWPKRGSNGHGYDPMFQPDGFSLTIAEMDQDQKNRISHRALAFSKLVTACFR